MSIPTTRGPWASSSGMLKRAIDDLLRSSEAARPRAASRVHSGQARIRALHKALGGSPPVASTADGPARRPPRRGRRTSRRTRPLLEHGLAEVLALGAARRDREHGRAD